MITPTSSPTKELDQPTKSGSNGQYSLRYSTRCHDNERDQQEVRDASSDEENAEDIDGDDGRELGIFPLDPGNDLDVDLIEQNWKGCRIYTMLLFLM